MYLYSRYICNINHIDIALKQSVTLHLTLRRRPSQNPVQPGLFEGTLAMNISENMRLSAEGQMPIMRVAGAWRAWLQARLGRFGASWKARWQRARGIQELAAFSDRELWDLGLGRSDLQAIINGTYRRD